MQVTTEYAEFAHIISETEKWYNAEKIFFLQNYRWHEIVPSDDRRDV